MAHSIAICGASGLVGQELIQCIHNLNIEVDKLDLFASPRSAGNILETPFGKKVLRAFNLDSCTAYDIVFLCVSGSFSEKYAADLRKQNSYIIDNSSHFRYDPEVPLVIPEINGDSIKDARLIANPNCSTAILAMTLAPIYKKYGIKQLFVSTYQATSGGGKRAMTELQSSTEKYLAGEEPIAEHFQHPIAFNLIPAIDTFQDNGYTREEMKVVWETQKIFDDKELEISCTAVRIPTFRAHAESVIIHTHKAVDIADVRALMDSAEGIELVDDIRNNRYPMPLTASHKYLVEVGRIRHNLVFKDYGIELFLCGDQLLKGAALNAAQIAQFIFKSK